MCIPINIILSIVSGFIAGIIAIIAYDSCIFIRNHCRYRKHIGKYHVIIKGKEEKEDKESVEISKVKGNKIFIIRKHKTISNSYGEIIMSTPNFGFGSYHHEKPKHGWGQWKVHIHNNQFLVDIQYQKNNTEKHPSHIWIKQ